MSAKSTKEQPSKEVTAVVKWLTQNSNFSSDRVEDLFETHATEIIVAKLQRHRFVSLIASSSKCMGTMKEITNGVDLQENDGMTFPLKTFILVEKGVAKVASPTLHSGMKTIYSHQKQN